MIIEKDRRTNKYIMVDRELTDSELAQKRKMLFALSMREREAKEQYKLEHKHGYCPVCHMLIPLSGECDCGYSIKKR